VRRNPKLAREIRARRFAAPTRNRWSGALWAANDTLKTIFAIIGALVVLVIGLVFFGRF
jgi:hypothetical protein